MTTEESKLKDFLPKRLRQNYDKIRATATVSTGVLEVSDIERIQELINDAQPQTYEEEVMRTMVQFLYRRDNIEFYKFLTKNH